MANVISKIYKKNESEENGYSDYSLSVEADNVTINLEEKKYSLTSVISELIDNIKNSCASQAYLKETQEAKIQKVKDNIVFFQKAEPTEKFSGICMIDIAATEN